VLVLFFVYPLKFLFTFVTVNMFDIPMANPPTLDASWQVDSLYFIYGAGFAGTWGLYAALYAHAWARRDALDLDPAERLHTRAALNENLISVIVCMLSIVLAAATSSDSAPGFVYFLLGPLQGANGWWFGRQIEAASKVRS
jgi:hypothetical protein